MTLDDQLAICARATAGNWWRTDPPWGHSNIVHAGPSDDPHAATHWICWAPDLTDVEQVGNVEDDMLFIATAKTHYPDLLRRMKRLREIALSAAMTDHTFQFTTEQQQEIWQLLIVELAR